MPHVHLEVLNFIREQEGVWHETIVIGEKALETTDDHAEDVFLCEVVHQRISVYESFSDLDNIDVVVSQGETVPEDVALGVIPGLSVPELVDDVLNGINFVSAVRGVDHDVSTPSVLGAHRHVVLLVVSTCLALHTGL